MINYELFNKTSNHCYNICRAIEYCKKNNIDGLKFEKGIYELYPEMAAGDVFSVSNHDISGFERAAFLIKNMSNFTLDLGDSLFISHGVMIGFAIVESTCITIKNFTYTVKNDRRVEAIIEEAEDVSFEVKITDGQKCNIIENKLYLDDGFGHKSLCYQIMDMNDSEKDGYSNDTNEMFPENMKFTSLENGNIKVENVDFIPKKGRRVVLCAAERYGCTVLIDKSLDVEVLNATMHESYGMGVIAQVSENIRVNNMTVKNDKGKNHSLYCDATHFVCCTGKIEVSDSYFEGMMDDALNVHGLFTKVISVDEDGILVRDMHPGSKNIPIFEKGSRIAVMEPHYLIAEKYFEVKEVKVINDEFIYLYLDDTSGITLGYTIEELNKNPEVYFINNTVLQNRARGILLASKGKTVVSGNRFNTPGAAISFESNGHFWYESGGVSDALIENNIFYNCSFSEYVWGSAVIQMSKRKKNDGKRFYHGKVVVRNNKFVGNKKPPFIAADCEFVEFFDNETQIKPEFRNCKEVRT